MRKMLGGSARNNGAMKGKGVLACQGNRWLILLPWPVVGSRYRAFLVGRRMTGLSAWWFRHRARKKLGKGRAGGSVT
jgi:hypothetical protein